MKQVAFLTRRGCASSPILYGRVLAALERRGAGIEVVVHIDGLPPDDPRTGYGTPTVLIEGEDLFGLETPAPAAPT